MNEKLAQEAQSAYQILRREMNGSNIEDVDQIALTIWKLAKYGEVLDGQAQQGSVLPLIASERTFPRSK